MPHRRDIFRVICCLAAGALGQSTLLADDDGRPKVASPRETAGGMADEPNWAERPPIRVGDGVVIRCKNPHDGGQRVMKRTLIARAGDRFKLDRALREDVWQGSDPTIAVLFPLISGEFVSDCVIENITLDGNKEKTDHF